MQTPEELVKLITNFESHIDELKSNDYKELSLCTDYLNPLFKLLGWDIDNSVGKAEKFRDVIQQYRLTIGGSSKAPDYLFKIGNTGVFFVEAKKPSVDIAKTKDPAFQLRRYGWNKKEIDISILTDFENLSIYDCRIKPSAEDDPRVGRITMYSYKDYLAKWQEIHSLLARENVEKGSLDKLLKEGSTKGSKESVDESFLKMIEEWREILARNIALRNENLDVKQLNFAVQQTIDRIIFLRIAEDRGLESPNQLQSLTNSGNIYGNLLKLYELADSRYNSGLFHFRAEKGIDTPPDTISMSLSIDDKVLKDMIVNLYYPKSPFDFSAMPADILGQVYERFLGKVIRLTDGHHAKVEEKPEVRKAGGVYYTPTYIVDYIVQNTVGKLVEDKTPDQVAKLRILDPACGSGSFLIGAYQFLLDWHLDWYQTNDRDKWLKGKNPPICEQMSEGQRVFRLTTEKRKEILKNNIYGVDIDRQAVEVSKLNLLLKVLEQENNPDLFKHNQRALPDLGSNIKCGNSLIGMDFYNGKEDLFNNPEETWRVNAFDWDREFPTIIRYKSPSPFGRRCPDPSILPPPGEGGCKPDEGVLSWSEYNKRQNLLSYASTMRKDSTDAEKVMWEMLRDRRFLNLKFRRQYVTGDFILDFYCKEKEFAIELDGGQHTQERNIEYDKRRTEVLQKHGIKVVRFWNNDVLKNLESVMEALYGELAETQPHPNPLLKGEGAKELEDGFGFDAVIGNPPYIRIQTMKEWAPVDVEFYKNSYKSASKGNYDIYVVFVEKALQLLGKSGLVGFILPHKFFNSQYGESLREIISKGKHLSKVVHFGDQQVFDNATTYTALLFLSKLEKDTADIEKITDLKDWIIKRNCQQGIVEANRLSSSEWNFSIGHNTALYKKINTKKELLSSFSKIFVGLQTSADPVYILQLRSHTESSSIVFSKALKEEFEIENGILRTLLKGMEIQRYTLNKAENMVIYPYLINDNSVQLLNLQTLKDKYPLALEYLNKTKTILEGRENGKWKVEQWWQYGRNQNIAEMGKPKIITQVLAKRGSFYIDPKAEFCFVGGGNAGGYGLLVNEGKINETYLLGLLNSKVLDWYLKQISTPFRGGFYSYAKRFIELLPIRTIDFANKSDEAMHDRMVSLVETMLELNKRLRECGVPGDVEMIKRQIESTDSQIDQLVYKLYGFTDDEIRIVEESFADNKKK